MRRDGRLAHVALGAALLLAACGKKPATPDDAYLADLKQRVARLRPEVEREIGRKLRKVEVVVLPREKIVEETIPWLREQIARIENGPTGDDLEAEARATAEGGAEWSLASVDPRGRIVFPDRADPESLSRLVAGLLARSEFAQDPRALDLILLHELVHVHQYWHLETPAFHASVRSRADILARRAVLEGHAEYLTRRIASRIGLSDVHAKYVARHELPNAQEWVKAEQRVGIADLLFAYIQGENFVAAVVERFGYDEAVRRIFGSPPTLAAVSRPEEYFEALRPSLWGPVAEDLRRWLARERGEASVDVIALPMVREVAGDAAKGFREGFHLAVDRVDVNIVVLVAVDEAAACDLHLAWTRGLERIHEARMASGLFDEIRLSRKPDDWTLHYDWYVGHWRQDVVRAGNLVVDVSCHDDSEQEQGAERLARRAVRFLSDAAWREAWLLGDKKLLESEDPGLRLAAVSRMRRFVPDGDWEVRWLGRFYEARDGKKSEAERTAALVAAIEDPEPAMATRGLWAVGDMTLWEIPWPLLRARLDHREVAVRRAAWDIMDTHVAWEHSDPKEWQAPREEVIDLIGVALDDPDVAVRAEAVECLHKLEGEDGLEPLFRRALTDEHQRVRQGALITLSVYDFDLPGLLPEIVGMLAERPDVAAEALGNLGRAAAAALPDLRGLLGDQRSRAEAAAAIWKIAGDAEPLFTVVTESAAKGEPRGLEEAGEMGEAARPVVPEVGKALAHENKWTRIAAAKALSKIGGPEAKAALAGRLDAEQDPKVVEAIRKALKDLESS